VSLESLTREQLAAHCSTTLDQVSKGPLSEVGDAAGPPALEPSNLRPPVAAPSRRPSSGIESLTKREREVLVAAAGGGGRQAIGEALHISATTVANHLARVYSKLGVTNRMEAVALAIGSGALDMGGSTVVRRPSEEILPRLLRAAREHLGMEVSFISELSADRRMIRDVGSSGPAPVHVGCTDPVVDARQSPAAMELPVTRAWPVEAYVSVPLILSDGRVYGALCYASRSPDHSLDERDLRVVRMFADVARQYLDSDLEASRQHRLT